ncbi:hypothetical protein C3369_04235 [Escherichia sp. ESNIH1]|nr:hypothetical protein C3369_04235 [Escherichia sp. ESNIH1]
MKRDSAPDAPPSIAAARGINFERCQTLTTPSQNLLSIYMNSVMRLRQQTGACLLCFFVMHVSSFTKV